MNKTLHRIYIGLFFAVGISAFILLTINGYDYYTTPLVDRPLHPDHEMLKPTGFIGHGLGIIGSLMMITGVSVYMTRKRVRKFFNIGYLKHWLEFHIFLCSVGPLLILFHTSFKFGGIVAISFWSMAAVVLSGIIGRFIYVQIPRTIQGQELSMGDLNKLNEDLSKKLKHDFELNGNYFRKLESFADPKKFKDISLAKSFVFLIKDYFNIRKILRSLKSELVKMGLPGSEIKEYLKTAKSKMIITRRIGMLRTMQKLFRYWHIAHLPFAITMFVIMLIHVAVAILFGYTWIF